MNKGTSEERMCKERVLWPNQLGQWSPENCHCFLKSKRQWAGLTWPPQHLQEHFFRGNFTVSPMFSLLSIRTLFCLSFSWQLSESWCFRQPHLGYHHVSWYLLTPGPGVWGSQTLLFHQPPWNPCPDTDQLSSPTRLPSWLSWEESPVF